MPGILEEGQVTPGDEGENGSCKAPEEGPKAVQEEEGSVESETPSPSPEVEEEEGCKVQWQSGTSDSEANLNVSSASEPEATSKEPEAPVQGASVASEKEVGVKEDDSLIYNIHLSLPGVSVPVEVVLTSRDTVHDLLQFALERPECCYRTALSVHHKGKRLDDFFEIGSIKALSDGDTVEIVEEIYTQRDVRLHVQRLKDLLSTSPLEQSMMSTDGLTLSFLTSITQLHPESPDGGLRGGMEDLTHLEPPSYCTPGTGGSPATPLSVYYPPNLGKHFKFPECLKAISYSSWNPPPSKRKMKGDLLYLDVTTLEGQEYYITATPSGFFLNKSTSRENFDPTPRKTPHQHRHLVGLISQISPLFKKNFAQLQKFGEGLHAFEILPVPYPVTPWIVPRQDHKPTNLRLDDTMSLQALPDELVLGQMRDWNEELQTAREFPITTPSSKVFRDRALFKIHSDFVRACTRGAQAVVDGSLQSLNPGEESKFRMYMWNNIFFSFAFDGHDHYKKLGGDSAARAASSADLQGVASFERLELKDLYTLGTVLVDYCGYRVVCQTIIPGLLQRVNDAAVVYGSIDTGKNIKRHQRFAELLSKVAEQLHIREHRIHTEKDDVISLPSSVEVKGIIGNDQRHYALDLFRIFPPDANYMPAGAGSAEQKFRHKMAILRPEFLDTFLSFKFMLFLRLIKEKANSLKCTATQESSSCVAAATSTSSDAANSSDPANSSDSAPCDTSESTGSSDAATGLTESADTADIADTKLPTSGLPDTTDSHPLDAADSLSSPPSDTADTTIDATPQDDTTVADTHDMVAGVTDMANATDTHDTAKTDATGTHDTAETDATDTPAVDMAEAPACEAPEESRSRTEPKTGLELRSVPPSAVVCPSILPSSNRAAIMTSISKPHPLSKEREGVAPSELHLLDSHQVLMEEKEVGPDISYLEDLSAMEKETEPLPKPSEGEPELIKEALMEAGSSSMEEFLVHFNVDILSPGVIHADEESVLEQDRKLIQSASTFLVESVIPRFVHDCIQLAVTPMDGEALSAAMHARGINMRYLGQVAVLASLRDDLHHIKVLSLSEMVIRLAKRRLRQLLQESPQDMTSEAICHFLNCLLSQGNDSRESREEPSLTNGHVRKRKNKKKTSRGHKGAPHLKLTREKLWSDFVEEMKWYYKFDMKYSSLSELCKETGVRKTSILRDVCKRTGVQILLRDYDFTSSSVFTDDDVIAMYPLVRHTNFRPVDPTALYEVALSKFSGGQVQLSHELFANALQMFVQVYGTMHLDTANCYRHMARIEYMLSDYVAALSNQHKATLILERVLGVDHPETVSAYINLALYCQANTHSAAALRLLYRARYLLLLIYGEDHPEMATCDSNIAIILHSIKDYRNSHTFLANALVIQNKYYGNESVQSALTYHLLARAHSYLGDFRAALNHEKITFSIYQKKLGPEHERTIESSQCLKELTEKAVTVQKSINEMTGKGSGGRVLAEIPGSWGEVANMVNGLAKPHVIRKKNRRAKAAPSPNPTGAGQTVP